MNAKGIALTACLIVAGCVGPRPSAPDSAVVAPPDRWRAPSDMDGAEVRDAWWTSFDDAALTALVSTALESNVDVSIAAVRVEEARAQFRLVRSQQGPIVTADLAGGRQRDVSPFGQPRLQTAGQIELRISYDADLFGRLARASDAARAQLLSTRWAHDNVRLAVAAATASGYVALRALDARLEVLRDTLAARADALKLARRRAIAGYASQLDLAQADSEYRSTEQLIPAAELAVTRQENALNLLLGRDPMPVDRDRRLAEVAIPPTPTLVPATLLRRRPDIAAAEQQVVAADRTLDSARAAFMPDLQLSAAGGLVASTLRPTPSVSSRSAAACSRRSSRAVACGRRPTWPRHVATRRLSSIGGPR